MKGIFARWILDTSTAEGVGLGRPGGARGGRGAGRSGPGGRVARLEPGGSTVKHGPAVDSRLGGEAPGSSQRHKARQPAQVEPNCRLRHEMCLIYVIPVTV